MTEVEEFAASIATDLIADLTSQLENARLRLAGATESEALALAALALARQQAAAGMAMFTDDLDGANEPDPDAGVPVLPARALSRPLGSLKGRAWSRP